MLSHKKKGHKKSLLCKKDAIKIWDTAQYQIAERQMRDHFDRSLAKRADSKRAYSAKQNARNTRDNIQYQIVVYQLGGHSAPDKTAWHLCNPSFVQVFYIGIVN